MDSTSGTPPLNPRKRPLQEPASTQADASHAAVEHAAVKHAAVKHAAVKHAAIKKKRFEGSTIDPSE